MPTQCPIVTLINVEYKYKLFQWLVRNGMDDYFNEEDYTLFLRGSELVRT